MSSPSATTTAATKKLSSQETIDDFWKTNLAATAIPSTPSSVLPSNVYAKLVGKNMPKGSVEGRSVTASFDEAVKECEMKVAQIVAECRRNNKKYTDPHFNLIEVDFCLEPLTASVDTPNPASSSQPKNTSTFDMPSRAVFNDGPIYRGSVKSSTQPKESPECVKRVGDIFDNPKFYVGSGANVKDFRQGAEGDCWLLASLGSLCVDEQFPRLIEKICPEKARDEKCGVYGFVFCRDGEWISEVIDDQLYVNVPDYDDCDDARRSVWEVSHSRIDPDLSRELYRKTFQSNSDALYYGSCAHPDETWVPLLEKAFAKAHGDYGVIEGGWPGEGVEDLTGGITTKIVAADVLDKDLLWNEGLLKVNKDFLFNMGTRVYYNSWESSTGRQGIQDCHAYSVIKAINYGEHRLVLVKNPWAKTEWNGPWSDGSKEWTPEALRDLNHSFGDDGIFWMPYADFLRRYDSIWRTRLFAHSWTVCQHWTTVPVPWFGDHNETSFTFSIPKSTTCVVVLSQLDTRYFRGLVGQYEFVLAFRLHRSGDTEHLARGYSSGQRSAVTELDLEAGDYDVLLQISATRDTSLPKREDVVKENWLTRRDKLIRIGFSYDIAQAKGKIDDPTPVESTNAVESAKGAEPAKDTETVVSRSQEAAVVPGILQQTYLNEPLGAGYGTDVADAAPATAEVPAVKVEDPWNATCVVGLRVFCKDTSAVIRVKKPESVVEGVVAESEVAAKLDVDDPEKDNVGKVDANAVKEVDKEESTEKAKEVENTDGAAVTKE